MLFQEALSIYKDVHLKRWKRPQAAIAQCDAYLQHWLLWEVKDLTRLEVAKHHNTLGSLYPQTANKVLSHLRCLYTCLADLDLYHGPNPALGVKRFRQFPRKRVVQPGDEMLRLIRSIQQEPHKERTFLWLLASTAVRRDEARVMEWKHLDIRTGAWLLPVTKNKRPHIVIIHKFVLDMLGQLPHIGPYVFSTRRGKAWNYSKVWHMLDRIRVRANIQDLRLHDLRRTLASWRKAAGRPVQDIQDTLNHTSIQTTQDYMDCLNPTPAVKATIEEHTEALMAYLQPPPDEPITGDTPAA